MNTEIILITDRSGSMSSINAAACAGINAFMQEQATVPGDARVTHIMFNSDVTRTVHSAPMSLWKPIHSLNPGGYTAMLDAIGLALTDDAERIADDKWADQVIVVITTDGHENQSHKFTWGLVNQLITQARARGWQFIFTAANIDAGATAERLGIDRSFAYSFTADAASTAAMYSQTSATTRAMRSWGL